MAAFEELVRRYEGRIFRFVLQFCRNSADASELTQDTFVKSYQAIARFDPRQSFGPWLFTIARRKCIDHNRAALRRIPEPRGASGAAEAATGLNPAESLAAAEEGRAIWDIVRASVSPLQFEALWLRYAEDMSLVDTARVLRKPQTLVKVLLFRARQVLSRKLSTQARERGTVPWRARTVTALPLPPDSLQHIDP